MRIWYSHWWMYTFTPGRRSAEPPTPFAVPYISLTVHSSRTSRHIATLRSMLLGSTRRFTDRRCGVGKTPLVWSVRYDADGRRVMLYQRADGARRLLASVDATSAEWRPHCRSVVLVHVPSSRVNSKHKEKGSPVVTQGPWGSLGRQRPAGDTNICSPNNLRGSPTLTLSANIIVESRHITLLATLIVCVFRSFSYFIVFIVRWHLVVPA